MPYVQRARRPFWQRNQAEVVDDGPAVVPVAARPSILSQVIWFLAGIILLLLAFRFVLSLLGANPNNSFANFIYSASHPFVAPFFGLFHYNVVDLGATRFEIYTLFAMAVYAAIAWGLSYLANIGRRY
jgi:YggT family protein